MISKQKVKSDKPSDKSADQVFKFEKESLFDYISRLLEIPEKDLEKMTEEEAKRIVELFWQYVLIRVSEDYGHEVITKAMDENKGDNEKAFKAIVEKIGVGKFANKMSEYAKELK